MHVVWTIEDWASAVVDLPFSGGLPERTVLVPHERVAHALRRALIERGAPGALVGTRFVSLLQLANEIAAEAGENATANDLELGPMLVREALADVEFTRFRRDDLLEVPGWDEAFARTLGDVAGVGLTAADLFESADPHVRDLGRVLELLEQKRELLTASALLRRAASLAGASASRGATLAVVTGFESPAEVALLRALPEVTLALWAVRPVRLEHLDRVAPLFGHEFSTAGTEVRATPGSTTALQYLQAHLFGNDGGKPAAQDDSVRVAIYAGVHEEVDAAVGWVVEQVVERGVPAQEIAILSPTAEPYGSLLRARLAALPWNNHEGSRTFSERGVPLLERSDGARLLLAIRALREGLSREALAPLLPILRGRDQTIGVGGLSRAWELLNAVAVVGGDRAHLERGRVWPQAWESAVLRLESRPATGGGLDDLDRTLRAELQGELAGLGAAIEALTDILRQVICRAPLSAIGRCLSAFAQAHLKLPPAKPPAWAALDQALGLFKGHEAREPTGTDALDWLEATLCDRVVQSDRFGTPQVYLGTLAGVRGLSFLAVRVVGLVEGAVPSAVREDPVLPDSARKSLSPLLLTSRQRAHRQLAAFDDAVRAARQQLVVSAPRVSSEGSTRQPAAVLLDVMRALVGESQGRDLAHELEATAREGRARERHARERLPVSASARFERIARGDSALAGAETSPATALHALRAIRERANPTAQDGLLGGVLARESAAGLSAERPISASRLATLLSCPHRYLYEHVLKFRGASGPLPAHLLQVAVFGTWLHAIAEEFWREHGVDMGARKLDLEHHRAKLRALALERFEALRATYPFANENVACAEREALCDQLEKLLVLDWADGRPRPFVAVERGFGYDEPCALQTGAGVLHVRGKIDKLDRDGDTILVRDIKTGGGKPRKPDEPPDVSIDLQLGVYAQVAKHMARSWDTPARIGVAYLYLRSGEPERSWTGRDYAQLDHAASEWLAIAVETLEQGAFVRSADQGDCRFCPYQAVCGPELVRARGVLAHERVPRRLALLKSGAG